ncbi:MAG: peptidase S41, partial [Bacteroidota bacterium]
MKTRFLLAALLLPLCIFAQDCNCTSDFQWLKETFEKNDAGFAYALNRVGEQAYQNHNNIFREKAKDIKDSNACVTILREWLLFFRSGHLGIQMLNQSPQEAMGKVEIMERYKDSERLDVDIDAFTKYLSEKETMDYEGIWVSEPYKIGIKKIE